MRLLGYLIAVQRHVEGKYEININCDRFRSSIGRNVLSFVPRNSAYIIPRSNGSTVTFSRTGISFESAPDHYATNGFDYISLPVTST